MALIWRSTAIPPSTEGVNIVSASFASHNRRRWRGPSREESTRSHCRGHDPHQDRSSVPSFPRGESSPGERRRRPFSEVPVPPPGTERTTDAADAALPRVRASPIPCRGPIRRCQERSGGWRRATSGPSSVRPIFGRDLGAATRRVGAITWRRERLGRPRGRWRISRGSSTVAIKRRRPPQRGQARTSLANGGASTSRWGRVGARRAGGEPARSPKDRARNR